MLPIQTYRKNSFWYAYHRWLDRFSKNNPPKNKARVYSGRVRQVWASGHRSYEARMLQKLTRLDRGLAKERWILPKKPQM